MKTVYIRPAFTASEPAIAFGLYNVFDESGVNIARDLTPGQVRDLARQRGAEVKPLSEALRGKE